MKPIFVALLAVLPACLTDPPEDNEDRDVYTAVDGGTGADGTDGTGRAG